ncbi:MAG: hypothetical protein K9K67_10220 [Bacteriovoracaceae bacterium]|nr:hypothetical protein [Bacteriovoracaceae bacterium]
MKFLITLFVLLTSCSLVSPKKERGISSYGGSDDVDCELLNKGCLLKRNSRTLIVFFRGWVSPHMASRYGGSRKQVSSSDWAKAARDLLDEDLRLKEIPLESSLFVVGSAHLGLSQAELVLLLEESGAEDIVFAAHSGGYKGMRATIKPMPLEFWENISGIWLLDNFYGGASFAQDLRRNFGEDFLREHCFGFITDHNRDPYINHYQSFCPNTLKSGVSHSGGVAKCMPFFERGESCVP